MGTPMILDMFRDTFEGCPAAKLKSSLTAHTVEHALRMAGRSYRTKINKTRKHGVEYIVMLLEDQ